MILIYGGAYQGKLDFARENYFIIESDIFNCADDSINIDFSKKCINGYHKFIFSQIKAEQDSVGFVKENLVKFKDKIIICDDISAGVVPISAETRFWREAVGRCATLLSKNSHEVWRIFCGIGTRLK